MVFLLARLIASMNRQSDNPVAVKEFGFPQLLSRNHRADRCLILPEIVPYLSTLRVSEARPNTLASWSLPSTEPLSSRYRTSIMSSFVHCKLTIHI